MATKPTTDYALLKFSGYLVLPVDRAVEAFRFLSGAEQVEYDWSNHVYKRAKAREDGVTLASFSQAQYATLSLEED